MGPKQAFVLKKRAFFHLYERRKNLFFEINFFILTNLNVLRSFLIRDFLEKDSTLFNLLLTMPQLDKVTFLSQFFWLCFFYLGFYVIILKFYLPKISRILALRKKKMGFSQEGMVSLQQENRKVRENYELIISKALITSKNLFTNLFSRTANWLSTNATSINKTHYQNVNASYIHSLGETSLSQNLLFYHASKNLPEKLTFKLLLNNLESFKSKSQAPSSSFNSSNSAQDTKKLKKTKK